MHVPAISWVHPQGGFLGLSLLNGVLRILTLGVYHFWGKTEVRQRIWSAVRVDGEPLDYRGTGGELFRGFLIVFFLILLPLVVASFASSLLFAAEQPRARALQSRVLGRRVPPVGHRHSSRAPLPALAHALARHPRRAIWALVALCLALSVDHAADTHHARLDRALAHRAAAEGAVRRYALRRQGIHLQRPRRTALQALLAGVVLGHRPLHRHARRHLPSSSASTCRAACPDRRGSRPRRGR